MVYFNWVDGRVSGAVKHDIALAADAAFELIYALASALGEVGDVSFERRGLCAPGHMFVSLGAPFRAKHGGIVVIELMNGTVAFGAELSEKLKARARPARTIAADPLGFSAGPKYGGFRFGLTYDDIRSRWPTVAHFAEELARHFRANRAAVEERDAGDYD